MSSTQFFLILVMQKIIERLDKIQISKSKIKIIGSIMTGNFTFCLMFFHMLSLKFEFLKLLIKIAHNFVNSSVIDVYCAKF